MNAAPPGRRRGSAARLPDGPAACPTPAHRQKVPGRGGPGRAQYHLAARQLEKPRATRQGHAGEQPGQDDQGVGAPVVEIGVETAPGQPGEAGQRRTGPWPGPPGGRWRRRRPVPSIRGAGLGHPFPRSRRFPVRQGDEVGTGPSSQGPSHHQQYGGDHDERGEQGVAPRGEVDDGGEDLAAAGEERASRRGTAGGGR